MGQEKNEIVLVESIKPDNYLIDNTKLVKELMDDGIGALLEVEVGKKNNKKIYIIVESWFDEVLSDKNFTSFDKCVYNSATTLWVAGNEIITPEMIWRTMIGDSENLKPAPQILGSITKSINKLRKIDVEVDFTEQAKLYGKMPEGSEKLSLEGSIIVADIINVYVSGRKKRAYKFYRAPLFYNYSKLFGQIITIPRELLQTKDKVKNTKEVIIMKEYLAQQLSIMAHPQTKSSFKRNDKVRYDTIYKYIGISESTHANYNKKTNKIRNQIKSILDSWIEMGYVASYEEYREGKFVAGIKITLPTN